MEIFQSVEEYRQISREILDGEISHLANACKMLHLPQKVISSILYLYFHAKKDLQVEPDDIVIAAASINLATRVFESFRPIEKIIQSCFFGQNIKIDQESMPFYISCVNKLELDICTIIDFDFNIPDFYLILERLCRESKLDCESKKRAWILLNDICSTPISVTFTPEEIVYSAICSSIFIYYSKIPSEEENMKLLDDLIVNIEKNKVDLKSIETVCFEIYTIYKKQIP